MQCVPFGLRKGSRPDAMRAHQEVILAGASTFSRFRDRSQQSASKSLGSDARLLLAEDDIDMRSLLAAELARLGYIVEQVRDGIEALAVLEEAAFDALILDVRMPRCSGLEVFRDLRNRGSSLPVVLISGFAEGVEELDEDSHVVVLAKPFSIDDLTRAIVGAAQPSCSAPAPKSAQTATAETDEAHNASELRAESEAGASSHNPSAQDPGVTPTGSSGDPS